MKRKNKHKGFWNVCERTAYMLGIITFFCWFDLFSVLDRPVQAQEMGMGASVVAQEEPKLTELPPVPFERNGVTWTYVGPERVAQAHQVRVVGKPSQSQKDSVAVQCELAKVKYSWNERNKTRCYYVILAISFHESGFRETAVGDGSMSNGAFQIYRKVHTDVSVEQANDFDFAASWTLNHLIANGFPAQEKTAVWSHNGIVPGKNESYYRNVLATADRFEKQGL